MRAPFTITHTGLYNYLSKMRCVSSVVSIRFYCTGHAPGSATLQPCSPAARQPRQARQRSDSPAESFLVLLCGRRKKKKAFLTALVRQTNARTCTHARAINTSLSTDLKRLLVRASFCSHCFFRQGVSIFVFHTRNNNISLQCQHCYSERK